MWPKKLICIFGFSFLICDCSGNSFLDMFKEKADQIIDATGANTECGRHLKMLVRDFVFRKSWAIEMADASAKLQPGILTGNLYQFGNFEQCLNIKEVKNDTEIEGQYCTVLVLPSSQFKSEFSFLWDSRTLTDFKGIKTSYHVTDVLSVIKLTYGICLPKSCSISNMQDLWNYVEHMFGITFHLDFYDFACRHKGKPVDPFSFDVYVYWFFGFMALIIVLSTIYDLTIHQKRVKKGNKKEEVELELKENDTEKKAEQKDGKEKLLEKGKGSAVSVEHDNIYMCFSVYSNFQKLFLAKGFEDSTFLSCLNGMKVLSMFWIIHGHRTAANIFAGSTNGFELYEWRTKLYNVYLMGASFSVDTFLTLSGMLLIFTYLKFRAANPHQAFSYTAFYSYRFLRLTPGLLATLLFYTSVLKLTADGPLWPIVMKKITISCQRSWWATLFFMTNLIDLNFQCVEQSWYLAVDSQLYFISPIILLNIIRHPKKVIAGMIAVITASSIYTYVITYNNEYGAVYFEGNKDYHEHIYQPTQIRISPWLVGVMFGYIIFKQKPLKMSKSLKVTLWSICIGVVFIIQYLHIVFTRFDYCPFRSALFNSTTRGIWAFVISLMCYLCVTGNGGFINQFLSAHVFKVLSRLTYSMFLTHLGVICYMVGSRRHPEQFSTFKCVHDFFGDFVLVLICSTVMCLSFEYPMIRIARMMFKKRTAMKAQTVGTNTIECTKKKYIVSVMSIDDIKSQKIKAKKYNKEKKLKEV